MPPYLSLAVWVPIVAGVAVLVVGRDRDASIARWIALFGAVAGFAVTLPLFTNFDRSTSAMQFVEYAEWIPRFDIHYHLGVDGISMLFILLNSFITVLVVWAGWEVITVRVAPERCNQPTCQHVVGSSTRRVVPVTQSRMPTSRASPSVGWSGAISS